MRIAITGASGNGKTTLARRLAETCDLRHVEIDALHHGPNWESCGADALRERVIAATAGDDWVTDSTYHRMLGPLVVDRADTVVWLDLPARLVLYRLIRRSYLRHRNGVELWNGNVEPGLHEQVRHLIWPAVKTIFENRRAYRECGYVRLRSDSDIDAFVRRMMSR